MAKIYQCYACFIQFYIRTSSGHNPSYDTTILYSEIFKALLPVAVITCLTKNPQTQICFSAKTADNSLLLITLA